MLDIRIALDELRSDQIDTSTSSLEAHENLLLFYLLSVGLCILLIVAAG